MVSMPRPRVRPLRELGKRALLALLLLMVSTFIVWLDRGSYVDNIRHDGVSFIDALYYSTVTMTTTGYGDITPLAPHARLLNAILITPMRVGFLVLLVGTTIAVLADEGSRTIVTCSGGRECAIMSSSSATARKDAAPSTRCAAMENPMTG